MSDAPESLADDAFWQDYWKVHDPVREIGREFYFARLLRDAVAGTGARSFLELGGHPGHFAVYARKCLGLEATLLDSYVDRRVVDSLLVCNGLAADDVAVVEADMFAYDPARRWDVVLSAGLIEHFVDVELVLRRHLDFLAPGGTLVVTLPNYCGLNGWLQRRFDPSHLAAHNLAAMDVDRLRAAVDALGLEAVGVGYYGAFRVWLEDLGRRPAAVRLLVYGLQAVGLAVDVMHIRSRFTSPHIAVVARARD